MVLDHLENNKVFGENQGAFRRGRRLEDNVFTLKGVCSVRKCRGQNIHLAFLDMSKALDRVWRAYCGSMESKAKYGVILERCIGMLVIKCCSVVLNLNGTSKSLA